MKAVTPCVGKGESITTFIAAQRMPSPRALSIASRHSPKVEPQEIRPTSTGPSSPKRLKWVKSGMPQRRLELLVALAAHRLVHLGRVVGPAQLVVLEAGDDVHVALLAREWRAG